MWLLIPLLPHPRYFAQHAAAAAHDHFLQTHPHPGHSLPPVADELATSPEEADAIEKAVERLVHEEALIEEVKEELKVRGGASGGASGASREVTPLRSSPSMRDHNNEWHTFVLSVELYTFITPIISFMNL